MILGKLHTVKYNADNHGQKQLRPEERPVSLNACNISMSYVKTIKRERESVTRGLVNSYFIAGLRIPYDTMNQRTIPIITRYE